jgi:hypothetical protein
LRKFLAEVIRPYTWFGSPTSDQEADAEALRYVLICRSRMLLFELSRDLRSFIPLKTNTGEEKLVNPEFNNPRTELGHQLHLTVQLAIDLVLSDKFVAGRIARDPIFAQSIYDAHYYPVNLWYADQPTVDCSRASLIDGISSMSGEPLALEDSDEIFLYRQVKTLLELLANLPELERQLVRAHLSEQMDVTARVMDSIPMGRTLVKAPEPGNPDVYQWNYNRSGTPYQASRIQDILGNRNLWDTRTLIEQFAEFLPAVLMRRPAVAEILVGLPQALSMADSLTRLSIPVGDAPIGNAPKGDTR